MTVDLGTSFIKAGIYDTEGNCRIITRSAVKSDSPKPGVFLQKGEEILTSVLACMKRAAGQLGEESRQIAAIGFTGQMAGFIGVDREWNDVTTWSCSLDTRYVPYANRQMEAFKGDYLEIGGTNAPLMAPKCQWFLTEFPGEAKRVAKYMLISSYIIGKLGRLKIDDAVVDCSYITWTGLADIRKREWSEVLCKNAGIAPKLLPRIVKSNEVCGYLDAQAAEFVGLTAGIPLVSGAGDKIAGCIGAGVLEKGNMIFEASSYGAVSCLVDEYRPDREAWDYDAIPTLGSREFYVHRYIPGSGITLRWFLDTFMESEENWKLAFAKLEEKVGRVPAGSDGLMAVGLLGGSAMPFDGELKGTWVGHTWSHRKEHFYRALLESFSYEVALTIESMAKMYPEHLKTGSVKLIGGGAGSAVWPQILSDVSGREFVRINRDDAALWGTAILAGSGIGFFKDMKEISGRTVKETNRITPNGRKYESYRKYMKVYQELKESMHGICGELNRISQAECGQAEEKKSFG